MADFKEMYQAFLEDAKYKGNMIIKREMAQAKTELYFLQEKFRDLDPFLNFNPDVVRVERNVSKVVFIGGSYWVSIPRHFVRDSFLEKGDNIDVLFMTQKVK